MYTQDVIGELLYIGIVAEKGRCYGKMWNVRYRKILKSHIEILSELLNSMFKDKIEINELMIKFIKVCSRNTEIGKFYKFSDSIKKQLDSKEIDWKRGESNYIEVDKLMILLMEELLGEVNKFILNNRRIYYLLNVLHNLPRVYLGKKKETMCRIRQNSISEKDALLYAFQNMNASDKERFSILLNKE